MPIMPARQMTGQFHLKLHLIRGLWLQSGELFLDEHEEIITMIVSAQE